MIRLTIHHNENVGIVVLVAVLALAAAYVWVKLAELAANEHPPRPSTS